MKKIYMTPETVIHKMEIHNVLASLSMEKDDTPEGVEEEDVNGSEKSKGFNGNLWDF